MAILLQEDIDVLVREGVIEPCGGSWYTYTGFICCACQSHRNRYAVYGYNEKFYERAYLDEDDILLVISETDTGGVDMRFASREAAMEYIRGTYARMKSKVLELKNRATIEAIDRLG